MKNPKKNICEPLTRIIRKDNTISYEGGIYFAPPSLNLAGTRVLVWEAFRFEDNSHLYLRLGKILPKRSTEFDFICYAINTSPPYGMQITFKDGLHAPMPCFSHYERAARRWRASASYRMLVKRNTRRAIARLA